MILKSHAKINLTLHIGRKAKGGLHQIESVMHPIDLYDNLMLKNAVARFYAPFDDLALGYSLAKVRQLEFIYHRQSFLFAL